MAARLRLVEVRRVSTKEQAGDDRAGLLRQTAENAATAARLGADIIRTFVVVDVSRPAMRATVEWRTIRELIAAPDVHLVVDRLDRLVGDLEGVEILNECRATGTVIHTSSGDFDLATSAGRLTGAIQSLFAGDELATIRHRVQGAKEAKRRAGVFPGSAIALATGIAYVRVKGGPGRWAFTPEIEKVRRAFELVAREGVTNMAAIARATGLATPRGVRLILENPIYAGVWRVDEKRDTGAAPVGKDGRRRDRRKVARAPVDVIEHAVFRPRGELAVPGDEREEAAVDVVTWEAVQATLRAKAIGYFAQREPRGDTRFTYSGVVACAGCGRPMQSRTRRAGRHRFDHYACVSTQSSGPRCATKYLRRELVNAGLDRLFGELLAREELVARLIEAEQGASRVDHSKEIAAARAKIAAIATKRTKLLDLYLDDDGLSRPLFDAKRIALETEGEHAAREVARLERAQAMAAKATALDDLRELLTPLLEFEFLSPRQKRDLLRVTFPRVLVSARGVETVLLQLPRVATLDGREVPVPEHGEPLTLRVAMTWRELAAPSRVTEFGLPEKPLYTVLEVRALLGWGQWMYDDRRKRGLIPTPTGRLHGKAAWKLDEVRALLATTGVSHVHTR